MENIKNEELKDLIYKIYKIWSIGYQEYNKSNHSSEIGTDDIKLNDNSENLSCKINNFRLDNENDSSNIDLQGGINRIEEKVNQLLDLKEKLISIEKQFMNIYYKLNQSMRDEPQNNLIEEDDEIRNLKKRIDEMEEEHRNKVDGIEPIIEINEKYKNNELSSELQSYIEELCGSSDVLALISLGRDEKILDQLWQYLREKAILNKPDVKPDVKFLNDYFEFCIAVYNSTHNSSGKFEIHEINLNDVFDNNYCLKTYDSSQWGNVVEIITHCYKKNGDVKYKGIVKVDK